jgi:hypothetical protein
MHSKFLLESQKGRDHSEDLGTGGRIILTWILGKQGCRCEMDSSDSAKGPMVGSCKNGNKPLGSTKRWGISGLQVHTNSFSRRTMAGIVL